jgi:uncharacterized membrane protein HdeD (DUF308 family)
MLSLLARNWWIIALRGLAAIVLGLTALVWPNMALTVLVLLFGAYVFVDGIFSLVAAVQHRQTYPQWWIVLLEGLVGILIGLIAAVWPRITALALLYLIAGWAIMTGLLEIFGAILLRREIEGEWLLALAGVLSIIFGLVLVLWPNPGLVAIVWLIGAYALVSGMLLLTLAFRLRGLKQQLQQTF